MSGRGFVVLLASSQQLAARSLL